MTPHSALLPREKGRPPWNHGETFTQFRGSEGNGIVISTSTKIRDPLRGNGLCSRGNASRDLALVYNYRSKEEHVARGTGYYFDGDEPIELPGLSCFLHDGERVFHTCSVYGRGGESIGGAYYFLDLTALGRQEDWEEPRERAAAGHDAAPDFST